jgi:hypothetical protein
MKPRQYTARAVCKIITTLGESSHVPPKMTLPEWLGRCEVFEAYMAALRKWDEADKKLDVMKQHGPQAQAIAFIQEHASYAPSRIVRDLAVMKLTTTAAWVAKVQRLILANKPPK